MSDQNKKVEPLRFEPAAPPTTASTDSKPRPASAAGRNWVLPALGVLVIVGLLVIFWLPQQVDTSAIDAEAAAASPARSKPSMIDVSPWSDAQLARQRKAAQEVLAELLDEQFLLEELQVVLWAAEDFSAAQALAKTADEQYRQQQFLEAAASYQAALDAMQTISNRADEVFEAQLQAGLDALDSDQAEAAITALDLAVILRPDHEAAIAALARAYTLAPLLALMQEATDAHKQGDLEATLALLQQAHRMDPLHSGAEAQLHSVEREITRRNFNRAMTAGYQALDDIRYDEAERQFLKARSILPAAVETESALQQTRSARTSAQIEAFRRRAVDAESRESWTQAIQAYQEILGIDGTVVFARAGLIRSQTHARLSKNLRAAIAKPERLGDDAIYRNTRALYEQALGLQKKGPLLRKQLEQLEELLRLALIPIPVLLHSDEVTEVTVYKVARLGAFRRHQLNLKPGTYTAVGVRSGYRDVRLQFSVGHNRENRTIKIACTEPI
jgi:tetratricopeptide (TPR) repeat protein